MPMRCWVPFFALVLVAVNCKVEKGGLTFSSNLDPGKNTGPEPSDDASTSTDGARVLDGPMESTASEDVAAHGGSSGAQTGEVEPASSGGTNALGGVAGGADAVSTGGAPASGGVANPGNGDDLLDSGVPGPNGGGFFPDAASILDSLDAPADVGTKRDASDAAASIAPDASRTLVWSDEFDSSSIAGVDTSKWSYVTWDPGHVNNEAQKYTNRIENVAQDGEGHLILRALNTPYGGFQYTSGRIETNAKFSFKFGRIEVRAKLPAGLGSFPGIVMLGTTGSWPQCGELALMEQYGQDKSVIYSTALAGGGPRSGDVGPTKYTFEESTSASSDFHVYSLDWYEDHLVFQVDGVEVTRSTFDKTSAFNTIPEYIALDVALGGDKGGAIRASQFPMEMIVDYVRVYSLQ
jgi:beta-glucanase (GH16 family)